MAARSVGARDEEHIIRIGGMKRRFERREAGASLPHTHAQLYALDFVPAEVARERERSGAYTTRTMGQSLLGDLLAEASAKDPNLSILSVGSPGESGPFVMPDAARNDDSTSVNIMVPTTGNAMTSPPATRWMTDPTRAHPLPPQRGFWSAW